ncbi:MAG TPA: hypothetical protein VEX68_04980 [Bryobacteraceae bacterium]|nr:hypothetical protein [Bryobacteraceae bacterium]
MRENLSRRDLIFAAGFGWLWPPNWFRRRVRLAEASFEEIRRGDDRRRYIWIHGNERTARAVLRDHMRRYDGRAFLIDNDVRNVRLNGGELDPNRMFSRPGAERNLRALNPAWDNSQIESALDQLDSGRQKFLQRILPKQPGALIVALHNNGPGYSVNDELAISDEVALNDRQHPDEFMLCTMRQDYEKLAKGPYNVLLQSKTPPDDDGSLSRLCAARGIRYVNIEAALGATAAQSTMLTWLEATL